MKFNQFTILALTVASLTACNKNNQMENELSTIDSLKNIQFESEQFADIQVLHYEIPGWEKLTLKEKKLVYYLAQAGYAGHDLFLGQIFCQHMRHHTA